LVKLYSNENFPFPVVEELRNSGYDVLTIQETGSAGTAMSDEDVLAFAYKENRILLTLNRRHFIRLHNSKYLHSGIITCTFDPDFKSLASRIHTLLNGESEFDGKLFRINRNRI